jgi:hypothetical protein
MKGAPLRIYPYVAGARSRFSNWFHVDVRVLRRGAYGNAFTTKRLPRVRFFAGYDYSYMDMKLIGVYWSPRNPIEEGEETYRHYITLHWRPLFHIRRK